MTDGRKDILIIMGRYLPGYKDGGPVRSIKNLTDFLGREYNFKFLHVIEIMEIRSLIRILKLIIGIMWETQMYIMFRQKDSVRN